MAVLMKQFIDKFKAMEKIANETLAENPEALVGVDSLPGSEHDAKVPADAKKPDEEVSQGQPAGAESASGAEVGGDAKPLNEGKLEMDEPLLNPEKKPLISDDALTAKVANAHLASLVNDLLSDLKSGTQKKAGAKSDGKKADTAVGMTEKKAKITLDDETISKIAAANAVFMMGRKAAEDAIKKASADNQKITGKDARALIKAACIKAAQEDGLDPAAAEAAAENAMAAAGVAPADAAAADAAAADTAAADASAADTAAADAAAEAGAEAGAAEIPEDVTEEELATAIVDLVDSGELDPDTAKAIVEEIAGEDSSDAPTEDQAAEIIAQGIESGKITPEQAQEIAAAVEAGSDGSAEASADAGAAAADASDAEAEAQGAADAEAAIQDAADEAQGAADAEEAMKSAAAMIRSDAITKVANAITAKRCEKKASASRQQPGSRILSKVASILEAKKASASDAGEKSYLDGFKKKAEEMGVNPAALAKYVCENAKSAK